MKKFIYYALLVILIQGCKKTDTEATYSVDTNTESAQQVGDVTASIDESGGNTSTGTISMNSEMDGYKKTYARLSGQQLNQASISRYLIPEAQAALCNITTFNGCGISGAGKRVRDFADCTTGGGGAISGTVTLTFTGTQVGNCTIPVANDAVSRVPNFTITGLRGATFGVTATTTGQTVTRTGATTFNFSNTGIRRVFTTPKGSTILDVTTSTGTPIVVTGNNRTNRTMSGGSLIITNNLTSEVCTLTPSSSPALTWTGGCNCPTSGYMDGTCTGGKTFKVTFGSCGTATVDATGDTGKTVTLDRCSS